jgi:hypothetical protein
MPRLFFILILLSGQSAFGQATLRDTSFEIARINAYIGSVNKNTGLTRISFDKTLKQVNKDSAASLFIGGIETYAVYYDIKNTMQKISLLGAERLYSGRPVTEYYFENEKLVCVHKVYTNATRMGSCGAIEFDFLLFLHDGSLIGMEKKSPVEGFFATCYKFVISEVQIANELSAVLKTIKEYKADQSR